MFLLLSPGFLVLTLAATPFDAGANGKEKRKVVSIILDESDLKNDSKLNREVHVSG